MTVPTTSRYSGLSVVTDEHGSHVVQRPIPPLQAPAGSVVHTLIVGENLEQLARRYYGQEDLWWRIADANPARHPGDWKVGDQVIVPPPSAFPARRK